MAIAIGYLQVQTGLVDLEVDRRTAQDVADMEKHQAHALDALEFKDRVESIKGHGEFQKALLHLAYMFGTPVGLVVFFMGVAAALFAIVALTGRKAEYHTLLAICVHAGIMLVIAAVLQVAMMVYYRSGDVSTSLAPLGHNWDHGVLAAIEPFDLWFWALVYCGVVTTRQMGLGMARLTCATMALMMMGWRLAISQI
jgi:hypothetical protein